MTLTQLAATHPRPLPHLHSSVTATAPPSVTTHFSTLVRKNFHIEPKLASTHLSQVWSWSHGVSPLGSQQDGWLGSCAAGEEGRRLRMPDGGGREGEAFTPLLTHLTGSDIPIPSLRVLASLAATVEVSWGSTNLVPNPFFPRASLQLFKDNHYALSLHLLFSRPKPRSLAKFMGLGFGALH